MKAKLFENLKDKILSGDENMIKEEVDVV